MSTNNKYVISFAVVAFTAYGNLQAANLSNDIEVMTAVLNKAEVLKFPNKTASDFDKWAYDTILDTVATCTSNVYYPQVSKEITKRTHILTDKPTLRSGAFSFPSDSERVSLCKEIAINGFKPWCSYATVFSDSMNGTVKLPNDYVQLKKYDDRPRLTAALSCFITAKQINKQTFVPDAVPARWVMPPRLQAFNLSMNGQATTLLAGSIEISLPQVMSWNDKGFSNIYTAVINR